MAKFVTPDVMLTGAVFNLQQCGLFVRDAALLYESGSYAAAVIFAALALEALGKWKTLLRLCRDGFKGEQFTFEAVSDLLSDHEKMQEAGNLSTSMISHNDLGLGKLMQARFA